jgi:hypothetical protein
MERNKNNLVSSGIINNSVWNRIGDYLPVITNRSDMHMQSWAISARLPKDFYKKLIAHIIGNPKFRETVEEKIKNVFRNHAFDFQSFLEIRWHSKGASFETDGVNGCMVYVYSECGDCGYSCHNIDTFEQASVLFLALSTYLPDLYSALEIYEREKDKIKFLPLSEGEIIYKRIILNNNRQSKNKEIKDCQTTLETYK